VQKHLVECDCPAAVRVDCAEKRVCRHWRCRGVDCDRKARKLGHPQQAIAVRVGNPEGGQALLVDIWSQTVQRKRVRAAISHPRAELMQSQAPRAAAVQNGEHGVDFIHRRQKV
jgi:hypothetical protein